LADWSLLTNHGRLLLAIENEPGLRVRDMAARLDLSERGVALILRDLREAGYVTSRREGRRVFYTVVAAKPLRTDYLRHQTVGQLLALLAEAETSTRAKREKREQTGASSP
jgi:DNA-binding transcriptional ArsR family regulator